MAEYDLSQTIIPYLDRHLAFPLLAHLVETSLFPVEQVQAAQYELAKGTNMVDYAVSLFEQLHPDEETPQGLSLSPPKSDIPSQSAISQNSLGSEKGPSRQMSGCSRRPKPSWTSSRTQTWHRHFARIKIKTCSISKIITTYALLDIPSS